jgi:hypothetical protein
MFIPFLASPNVIQNYSRNRRRNSRFLLQAGRTSFDEMINARVSTSPDEFLTATTPTRAFNTTH